MSQLSTSSAPAGPADDLSLREAALTRLLRKGDAAAFRLVIEQHNRRLYRVARGILNDDAEAEDAVQDAYVRALGNFDGFRGQSSLSTWLTRIVINEALARRRGRRATTGLAIIDAVSTRTHEPASAGLRRLLDDGPERAAARGELRRIIENAVEELPEAFRLVFMLRAVEGLSVEETAEHLGIPAATVKTRFHRARRLLQKGLDDLVAETLKDSFPFAGARCARMTASVLARLGHRSSPSAHRPHDQ